MRAELGENMHEPLKLSPVDPKLLDSRDHFTAPRIRRRWSARCVGHKAKILNSTGVSLSPFGMPCGSMRHAWKRDAIALVGNPRLAPHPPGCG